MKKHLLPSLISILFLASLVVIFDSPPREVRADVYNSAGQVNWNSVFASSITAIINTYTGYYQATTTAVRSEANTRAANDTAYAASATGNTFHEATIRAADDLTYAAAATGAVQQERTRRIAADTAIGVAYNLAITGTAFHLRNVDNTYAAALTSGLVTITKSTATPVMAGLTVNGNTYSTKGVTANYFNVITGTVLGVSIRGQFTKGYPGAATTNAAWGEFTENAVRYIFPIWLKP